MKVCLLSTSDSRTGGGFVATYRLHGGFQRIGVDSTMLVMSKTTDDFSVVARNSKLSKAWSIAAPTLDALPLKLYPNRSHAVYSLQWLPSTTIPTQVASFNPDIVNLHWICNGYINIQTLSQFNKPIVWTLMDMWAFTGGCHYSDICDRYINSCGACPQLGSTKEQDLSRWVWQRKIKAWQGLNLTFVSPSKWLAKCASSSSLLQNLRVEVIPFGLDIKRYKPMSQTIARELLNLPQDKQIILFGAVQATSDLRKGFHLLQLALQHLSQSGYGDRFELVIFGVSQPIPPVDLGFRAHYLGKLHDDIALQITYAAADVMIVPSLQESFGQTASESLACGMPVVAFAGSGLDDIVDHQQNGYLANPYDTNDLAQGIVWVLEDRDRYQKLSHQAREKAEKEFSQELQAKRYLKLFEEILTNRSVNL